VRDREIKDFKLIKEKKMADYMVRKRKKEKIQMADGVVS
jgi:hypothetical protein